MSIRRFFIDKITDPIVLTGEEHKHLSVVLRAKVGEEVILCCGDGYDNICRIESFEKNRTLLKAVRKEKNNSEPTVKVTMFTSLLKGDKNDLVVQKATELGAYEIYPVITKFVQAPERSAKTERLNKIAYEAAKQCGRSILTRVYEPMRFDEMKKAVRDFDLVVFPYENAQTPSLKQYLTGVDKSKINSVAVIIGSEGGFAQEEVEVLTESGIVPLTLGKRIMRAETANIAVLAAVMYELEQWQ